jgi:hypothetical protein
MKNRVGLSIIAATENRVDLSTNDRENRPGLSIVQKKLEKNKTRPGLSTDKDPPQRFASLNRRRIANGIGVAELLARARVHREVWFACGSRPETVRASSFERLENALDQLITEAPETETRLIAVTYRATVCLICTLTGTDPGDVLQQDFRVQRPTDPHWLSAARYRRLAIAVLALAGVERPLIKNALGCTRQNVQQAIAWATEEGERHPETAGLIHRCVRLVGGRV